MSDNDELACKRFRRLRRYATRDFDHATILLARKYLRDYPDEAIAWLWLGGGLMGVGQGEQADVALRKALELGPPNKAWVTLGYLGRNCKMMGKREQAEAWFRQLIDQFPTFADGYIYLGSLLGTSGKLEQAEAVLRQGTRCENGCPDEAWQLLGVVLGALERYAAAADCFREALRIDPEYRLAKRGLKDVLACLKYQRD